MTEAFIEKAVFIAKSRAGAHLIAEHHVPDNLYCTRTHCKTHGLWGSYLSAIQD